MIFLYFFGSYWVKPLDKLKRLIFIYKCSSHNRSCSFVCCWLDSLKFLMTQLLFVELCDIRYVPNTFSFSLRVVRVILVVFLPWFYGEFSLWCNKFIVEKLTSKGGKSFATSKGFPTLRRSAEFWLLQASLSSSSCFFCHDSVCL